jgi:hypothetical protein
MTVQAFQTYWHSTYPESLPVPFAFVGDFVNRSFRIHSLPESKRYADNEEEWDVLLERQNTLINDLLGLNHKFILLTGEANFDGYVEIHPLSEAESIRGLEFTPLEPIDLHKAFPDIWEEGKYYPIFSEQLWEAHKFDNILKDIAEERLQAFFLSVEQQCLIAPYDGGVDCILKDRETRDYFKAKYKDWLSAREDGM